MAHTKMEFRALIRESIEEQRERFESGEDAGDILHEIVDGCLPVYYIDTARLWIDLGMSEPEEFGGDDDSITARMAWAIYEAGYNFAAWALEDIIEGVTA